MKEDFAEMDNAIKEPKHLVKTHSIHWTLGRYDLVIYSEAPDEEAVYAAAFDSIMVRLWTPWFRF